jgi:hypothetical protein
VALSQEEVKGQQQAVEFRRDLLSRLKAVQPEGRSSYVYAPSIALLGQWMISNWNRAIA